MNILFTSPGCAKCQLAKGILDDLNIEYVISQDAHEAERYDISSVPALVMDGEVLHLPAIIAMNAKGGASHV